MAPRKPEFLDPNILSLLYIHKVIYKKNSRQFYIHAIYKKLFGVSRSSETIHIKLILLYVSTYLGIQKPRFVKENLPKMKLGRWQQLYQAAMAWMAWGIGGRIF